MERITKTRKPRTVYIGPDGIAGLREYQARWRGRTARRDPDGWLLSYDGGRTPMRAKSMTAYMARLSSVSGYQLVFHSLRHFAAS